MVVFLGMLCLNVLVTPAASLFFGIVGGMVVAWLSRGQLSVSGPAAAVVVTDTTADYSSLAFEKVPVLSARATNKLDSYKCMTLPKRELVFSRPVAGGELVVSGTCLGAGGVCSSVAGGSLQARQASLEHQEPKKSKKASQEIMQSAS